jgi:RimJ/RimL family protein N-acetyltransferase
MRVSLRALTEAEVRDLAAGGDGGLDWLGGSPHEGTREAARGFAGDPDWGIFAIVRLADGLAIGGIGFHGPPVDGSVEIGFDLVPEARGEGYATEALGMLSASALERVDAVVCTTETDNTASRRVMERAGFTRVSPGRYELRN